MITIYIIAAVSLALLIVAAVAGRFRRVKKTELGVMGDQWLAEQRLVHGGDPNR